MNELVIKLINIISYQILNFPLWGYWKFSSTAPGTLALEYPRWSWIPISTH